MKKIVLPNKLTLLLQKRKGLSVTVQATMLVGSICEDETEKGYSHLVEHLLFEGTKKRKNAKILSSEIENVGGDFNAMTSNELTSYYAKVPSKHSKIAIDILSDMLLHSLFEEDKIEKEKRIVLEEIKMINDQPRYFQWLFFEKNLFKDTPYEIPVYGFEKDVSSATRKSIINYYEKYYHPENCIISIVGDFNEKEIVDLVQKYFGNWKNSTNTSLNNSLSKSKNIFPKNMKRVESSKKDIQQAYVIKGYVTPSLKTKEGMILEVIESILGKPQSGRLYDRIRNTFGYAYDINISYESFLEFGFIAINVGCDPKYKKKVSLMIDQELEKLKKGEIGSKEIAFAKSYIEGKFMLDLEDTHKEADIMVNYELFLKDYSTKKSFFSKKLHPAKDYLNNIHKVSKKDIVNLANSLFTTKQTMIEVIPKK